MSGLVKQKEIDYKDTNVANIGSDEDKKLRKEAAKSEEAWKDAGEKEGVEIWRINKFMVERVPLDHKGAGKFQIVLFKGDSYIILHTVKRDEDAKPTPQDLFFWIGKYSTQDEYGTAAYKTVELDNYLDDIPVQHREVHGSESPEFKDLFTGITYLEGGYESGFRKVSETTFEARFFRYTSIKGASNISCDMSEYSLDKVWKKLCTNHVFVLYTNDKIYVYYGSSSKVNLRFWCLKDINDSDLMRARKGTKIEILGDGDVQSAFEESLGVSAPEDFVLGLKSESVCECPNQKRLYRVDLSKFHCHQEDDDLDDIIDTLAAGDEIYNYDLEILPNYMYALEQPAKKVYIFTKPGYEKNRNNMSCMVAQQNILDKRENKREKRAAIIQVKEAEEFLNKCKE